MTDELDVLRRHSRERAFYAFGTAKIFERRARSLRWKRNSITYLGIVVPLLVGVAVLSFGTTSLPYIAALAGACGLVQIALSAWSLVAKWDDEHVYAIGAAQASTGLFNAWDTLAKRNPSDLKARVEVLDQDDQRQERADLAQHITEKEKRYAMRATLYHFGNMCQSCGKKPESLKPGKCDTCGNF